MKVQKVDFDVVPQVALWDELNMKKKQTVVSQKEIAGGEFDKSSAIVFCLFLSDVFVLLL